MYIILSRSNPGKGPDGWPWGNAGSNKQRSEEDGKIKVRYYPPKKDANIGNIRRRVLSRKEDEIEDKTQRAFRLRLVHIVQVKEGQKKDKSPSTQRNIQQPEPMTPPVSEVSSPGTPTPSYPSPAQFRMNKRPRGEYKPRMN